MSADLHCHTKLSDGSMGIDDIITLAEKRGLSTIAVTDHDCMAGTVRAKIIGERRGITVIPGVEISASDSVTGEEVNVLCYLADAPDRLEGLCHRNLVARKKAAQYMMLKVAQRYPITPNLVLSCAQGSTNVYVPHIMSALIESGMATEICGELYQKLFGGDDKPFLTVPKFEDTKTVIDAIHEAGGIAVLAHPGSYSSFEVVERAVEAGIDGFEIWCPENDDEAVEKLTALVKKNKLLSTGGSNFHGRFNKTCVTMGSYQTPDKQLSELNGYKSKLKRKQKAAQAANK